MCVCACAAEDPAEFGGVFCKRYIITRHALKTQERNESVRERAIAICMYIKAINQSPVYQRSGVELSARIL